MRLVKSFIQLFGEQTNLLLHELSIAIEIQTQLGLKLIEELSSGTGDASASHVEMEKAVLAGIVAQQIATTAESRLGEEAVVCSMLHTLGRMMLTYYMPERWHELQRSAAQDGREVDAIAPQLLGLGLDEIGHAAALHWGLPAGLINGMRKLAPPAPGRNSLAATVEDVNFLGAVVRIRVRMDAVVMSLDVFNDPHHTLPQRGEHIHLGFSYDNLLVLEETA